MNEEMNNDEMATQIAKVLAGIGIILRALNSDKSPLQKKVVANFALEKMMDGGEPKIVAATAPIIMGYMLDVFDEDTIRDFCNKMLSVNPGIQKITEDANAMMDKRDALIELYKSGGIHIDETEIE